MKSWREVHYWLEEKKKKNLDAYIANLDRYDKTETATLDMIYQQAETRLLNKLSIEAKNKHEEATNG